jgi:transmembrane sensor
MNDKTIIKHLLKEINEAEEKSLMKWLDTNPLHKKQFNEVQWIWEKSRDMETSSEIDVEHAWAQFQKLKDKKATGQGSRSTESSLFSWTKLVASIALVIGFIFVLMQFLPHAGKAYLAPVNLSSGEKAVKEKLLDGSVITLNKNTQLTYNQYLFKNERKVNFDKGAAYFQVATQPQKPFLINVDRVNIRVLGTSFHVRKEENYIQVIVDTGSVAVSSGTKHLTLGPKEKVSVDPLSGRMVKSLQKNELFRYYVDGKFHANDVPLADLVGALNEAYESNITVGGSNLGQKTITTTLKFGSLDQNLEVIKETFEIQIIKRGDRIILQ